MAVVVVVIRYWCSFSRFEIVHHSVDRHHINIRKVYVRVCCVSVRPLLRLDLVAKFEGGSKKKLGWKRGKKKMSNVKSNGTVFRRFQCSEWRLQLESFMKFSNKHDFSSQPNAKQWMTFKGDIAFVGRNQTLKVTTWFQIRQKCRSESPWSNSELRWVDQDRLQCYGDGHTWKWK